VQQGEVSGTYDALASRYDDWSAAVAPPLRERWAEKVDEYVAPGDRVIELGCGTGVPVGRRLSQQYEYEGIDASTEMLAKARAVLPGVALTHADMLTVQFPSASLDAVVSFYAISHVPRKFHAGLFASIASWLRPKGVFVGNLTSRDDPESIERRWLDAGPMRWSGFAGSVNKKLLAEAGFRVIESEVLRQVEPDGCEIAPMWFVAQRIATP
jgi:ubiquinone/menaquinone biosynthesis C-methylase UbiE